MTDRARTYRNPEKTSDLSARIKQRLAILGLEAATASKLAGLPQDAIRTIFRGSAPNAGLLAKLAPVLQASVEWLTGGGENVIGQSSHKGTQREHFVDPPHAPMFVSPSGTVPLLKVGRPEPGGGCEDVEAGFVDRPNFLEGRPAAYAMTIAGDDLAPAFRAGHTLYLDPSRPAFPGDFVRVIRADGSSAIGVLQPPGAAAELLLPNGAPVEGARGTTTRAVHLVVGAFFLRA